MSSEDTIIAIAIVQARILKKIDQHLSVHGISFTEFMVMHFLDQAANKTMRRIDLAESIGLSASGVTRLVNPMEKNHLVIKESNPRDARVSLVKLSDTGAELFQDALVTFRQSADSILSPLNDKQNETLFNLVGKLL